MMKNIIYTMCCKFYDESSLNLTWIYLYIFIYIKRHYFKYFERTALKSALGSRQIRGIGTSDKLPWIGTYCLRLSRARITKIYYIFELISQVFDTQKENLVKLAKKIYT